MGKGKSKSKREARGGAKDGDKAGGAAAAGQPSAKEAALQQALAQAFAGGPARGDEPDSYGKGAPTDRLQFGYAPAIAEEAVAFHSLIPARQWVDQRRSAYRAVFVEKRQGRKPNCEPVASLLKLKHHWRTLSHFNADLRRDDVDADAAAQLLDMLAAKQRVQ